MDEIEKELSRIERTRTCYRPRVCFLGDLCDLFEDEEDSGIVGYVPVFETREQAIRAARKFGATGEGIEADETIVEVDDAF